MDPNKQQLNVTFVSEGLRLVSIPPVQICSMIQLHMLSCNINKPKPFQVTPQ